MDDRLLTDFLAEAEDLIEELYGDIAALRGASGRGPARRELVAQIFRHVHTIKGTASAAGLEAASLLAHEFESLLDAVRSGRAPLDDEALEACEEAVGAVAESLNAAARGVSLPVPQGVVAQLRRLAEPTASKPASLFSDDDAFLPEEVGRTLSAHERQRLREAVDEGARAYIVTVEFDLTNFDEQYRRLSVSLGEVGEVVSTQPFMGEVGPDRVGFRIVYASAEGRKLLKKRAAQFGATLSATRCESVAGIDANDDEGDADQRDGDADKRKGNANEHEGDAGEHDGATLGSTLEVVAEVAAPRSPSAGVRVPLEELEELISTTHELFADTIEAIDFALDSGPEGVVREQLEGRARSVRRRFFELEERLTGLRMVPLRVTLLRTARAGRSVAHAAGKRVEFEIAGGEARLDRSLAERVADSLLHLVRNAVDHGVESEEERRAAGKPEVGRVRVEASAEGGLVILRVSDDGRGVDAELVARAAAEVGLITPGARVTEEQALRLIFRPGFSTNVRASLVSGRGVGLDVVERAVEETGGEVRVRSERGRGTTFELRLPTALALVAAHVVISGGQRYCIGAGQIIDAGEAERGAVTQEGARRTLRWRGRVLPLVEMSELLGRELSEPSGRAAPEGAASAEVERLAFVIARGQESAGVETDESAGVEARARAAVAVDSLEGESEVLMRGLGRHAKRWRGVGGATELRDGTVALVLDLPRLLEAVD
ncbi:MAG: two-component system, chemotaxis family, sensor kinase CheA [Acidobacteriota bacterium]|jgi:two-component system chemotaxis sensor kinase CheA|nr:two-component system, chemotaxis family, sensor kinase CheA [Acidobacteriota bacterium]